MDADGKALLSTKIADDEVEIVALLAKTSSLAVQLIWAVDIIGAPSALPLALLARAHAYQNPILVGAIGLMRRSQTRTR